MGRHSAPDDLEEDVDPADAAGGTSVAVADGPDGRHTRTVGPRPRPSVDDDPPPEGLGLLDDAFEEQSDTGELPAAPMVVIDAETSQAMVLEPIDEPLAAEPDAPAPPARAPAPAPDEPGQDVSDAPTTEIALADIARLDRPVPEETTARIAPVVDGPPEPSTPPEPQPAPDPPVPAPPTGTPLPGPAPSGTAPPAPQPAPVAPPAPRPGGAHATRHDVALFRRHGDVRARAVAAALVPFVVYVAVLAVIGKLVVHSLIWVWIPAIVAGVLVGLALDAGHRRYPAVDGTTAAPEPASVSEPANPA